MSANYNRKFVNNKQTTVSPKVESDINVLTALEVSEFLKPTALKTERGLDERALSLLQEVLPVVAEDGEKYRRKAEELAYRRDFKDIEDVREAVFRYIELFYNRKRLHSSLGYMTPVEYRLSKQAA